MYLSKFKVQCVIFLTSCHVFLWLWNDRELQ